MDQSLVNKISLEGILPENTLKTRVPQGVVERKVTIAPARYRNEIAKYIIFRDEEKCTLKAINAMGLFAKKRNLIVLQNVLPELFNW
jgi:hypothetical protein